MGFTPQTKIENVYVLSQSHQHCFKEIMTLKAMDFLKLLAWETREIIGFCAIDQNDILRVLHIKGQNPLFHLKLISRPIQYRPMLAP